jgi:hypothetical protein
VSAEHLRSIPLDCDNEHEVQKFVPRQSQSKRGWRGPAVHQKVRLSLCLRLGVKIAHGSSNLPIGLSGAGF